MNDEPDRSTPRRRHPIFSRMHERRPANIVDAIVDRKVEQGRAEGLFDDLQGAGKPLPDIDRHRPAGWFADRLAGQEQSKIRAERLQLATARAMPALWRLETEAAVLTRVAELNAPVARHNRTAAEPLPLLDETATLATWRRLRLDDR